MLRGKGRYPSPVGGALRAAFGRLGLAGKLAEQRALLVWPEVVGEQIAGATRALSVRDGVLVVAAKSSTWAHELIYRKAGLLDALAKELGRGTISDIRFLATGYEAAGESAAAEVNPLPGPEEWRTIELSAEELAAVADAVAGVADEDLRARMNTAMADGLRVRRWKEEQGWRPCVKCGLPHPGTAEHCAICRPREQWRRTTR